MPSTCWPAMAARRSASCATTSTRASTSSRSALAQAQLGAALAMLGDRPRAERAFAAALEAMAEADDGIARRDYGTRLRDGAAVSTLAAETGVAKSEVPRLIDLVAKAYAAKTYTSTQEQAWMLLAARALAEEAKDMRLAVNGQPHQGDLDPRRSRRLICRAGRSRSPTLASDAGRCRSSRCSAPPSTPEPAISRGFTIERTYYTLDGKKVDLASAMGGTGQLKQNDRLVVVLKVSATETGGRILLVDRLPAGPRDREPAPGRQRRRQELDWLKTTLAPEHTEFRDDRFVAAFNFFGERQRQGRRGRRGGDSGNAATAASGSTSPTWCGPSRPAAIVHPAATVEDMYRPERFARTAAGRLDITAKE